MSSRPVLSDGAAVYTPSVSQRRGGATTYDLSDRLGTASRQTSSTTATTATRTYDAFGMALATTGTPLGPFGFAGGHGYQEDGDTGLMLLGHRYYDASTGRFLTRDPVRDGRNWYAYCDNDPLGGVDPTGLRIKWDIIHDTTGLTIAILYWLIQISNTEHGAEVADEILYGDTEYVIQVNDQGKTVSGYDPENRRMIITMQEVDHHQWMDEDGAYHDFTLPRLLSHEVGHVKDSDEQVTIDKWENPISKDLGDSRKRKDHDHTREKPWRPPYGLPPGLK